MPDDDTPLTPIEQSRAVTGRRYYSVALADYDALAASLDTKYGFPSGVGTRAVTARAVPEKYDVPISTAGTHYLASHAEPHDISEFPAAVEMTKVAWDLVMPEEPDYTERPPAPDPELEPSP